MLTPYSFPFFFNEEASFQVSWLQDKSSLFEAWKAKQTWIGFSFARGCRSLVPPSPLFMTHLFCLYFPFEIHVSKCFLSLSNSSELYRIYKMAVNQSERSEVFLAPSSLSKTATFKSDINCDESLPQCQQ